MLRLVANIAGWFIVSIFLTLYNKLSVTTWGMDFPLTIACQHGRSALLAVPHLAPCATSGRAWRLWAARHSQGEARPLGAQPSPWVLEPAARGVSGWAPSGLALPGSVSSQPEPPDAP